MNDGKLIEFDTGKRKMLAFVMDENEDELIVLPLQSKRRKNGWKRVDSSVLKIPHIQESYIDCTTFWKISTNRVTSFQPHKFVNFWRLNEYFEIAMFIVKSAYDNIEWFRLVEITENGLVKSEMTLDQILDIMMIERS